MKTRVNIRVESETADYQFTWWEYIDDDHGEAHTVETDQDMFELAERLACTPELIDLIQFNFANLSDAVRMDLHAIWKRQDALETRIAELERR